MGTAAAENIALNVTSTANTAEVTKARSEVSAFGKAVAAAQAEVTAAYQKGGLTYEQYRFQLDKVKLALINQRDAQRDAAMALARAKAEVDTIVPRYRTAANGLTLLTQAAVTGSGSMSGLAMAAGNLATGFASVASSAKVAAAATGIGAVVTVISLAIGVFEHMRGETDKNAKAMDDFGKSIRDMARTWNLASLDIEKQRLFSGDPFAGLGPQPKGETEAQRTARFGGVTGLQGLQQRLAAQEKAIREDAHFDAQVQLDDLKKIRAQQAEVNALMTEYGTKWTGVANAQAVVLAHNKDIYAFETSKRRDQLHPGADVDLVGGSAERAAAFGLSGIPGVSLIGQPTFAEAMSAIKPVPIRGPQVAPIVQTAFQSLQLEINQNMAGLRKHVQLGIGATMADGLAAGITAGFASGGIKGAFAAGSKTLLAGFGGMLIDLGKVYVEYSGIMEALTPLLGNPFTAGFAGAAIGAALIGLGAALQGVASASRNGGGGAAASGNTFVPSATSGAGGVTLIVQTIDPRSGAVVEQTRYLIDRAEMLKTPVIAPPGMAA